MEKWIIWIDSDYSRLAEDLIYQSEHYCELSCVRICFVSVNLRGEVQTPSSLLDSIEAVSPKTTRYKIPGLGKM